MSPRRSLDVDGIALLGFVAIVTAIPVVAALARGSTFDASTNIAAALTTLSLLAIAAELRSARRAQRALRSHRASADRGRDV
jgi:hypothetical protein